MIIFSCFQLGLLIAFCVGFGGFVAIAALLIYMARDTR